MWIPEPIYQKLPFMYAGAGVALIPAFGLNGPAVISAIMLFAASVITAVWRYRHRAEPEPSTPSLSLRDEWEERRARRKESMQFDQD